MNEEREMKNYEEEETVELDIEELTDVQGGIDDDDISKNERCGLGCFIGAGYGPINR